MSIKFTPSARARFLQGLEYIRRDDPRAARKSRRAVESTLGRLEQFPQSGRSIPEFPELPHREVIVRPYRFFYRIVGKSIWIIAVWHGAQLPMGPGD